MMTLDQMPDAAHSPTQRHTQIDPKFIAQVLRPYRDHCKYLQRAEFVRQGQGLGWMEGVFGIHDSCYIDDTGHFNAVEFNICYNQIAYLHLGYCIAHNLTPELNRFSFEQFCVQQLSNFLIATISSSYATELNAKAFYGRFTIQTLRRRAQSTFIKTQCQFWDDHSGRSKGEVTLAVLDPSA